jgi:DNA mismatch repair protein MutS2
MAEEAGMHSLVLLDELGAATSPEEGAALGIALLEHFRQRGAMTVASTHHERLKAYAASTPGALNAAVEFDEVNLRPTYRLRVGVPGVSSGLQMAVQLGLSAQIIEVARKNLTSEVTETTELIRQLHQTQQELETLQHEVQAELERLQAEREELNQKWLKEQRQRLTDLERSVQGLLTQFRKEMQQIAKDLKEPKERVKLERAAARQMRRVEVESREAFDKAVVEHLGEEAVVRPAPPVRRVRPEELQPGARIKLRGIARWGVVLSRQGEDAVEVQIGSLRMRAQAEDVESVEAEGRKVSGATKVVSTAQAQSPPSKAGVSELQVRGMRVEEALQTVDKFLDQAALSSAREVRIVHGIGKGALKKAIGEFLVDHPHVESSREAEPEHGGAGATVVVLRQD